MDTTSVWRGTAPHVGGYAMLSGDVEADVLVIGGGITGVTTALLLAQQGRKVVLLEADEIASGATGNSTGNLYETLSGGLAEVLSRWGDDVTRQVVAVRRAAIAYVESHAPHGEDFGFRRCALMRYAQTAEYQQQIDKELEAHAKVASPVQRTRDVPPGMPAPAGDVFVLADQAQLQPAAYVQHLARAAAAAGVAIHEHSRVLEIDSKTRTVVTASGTARAQEIVMATHTPKGIRLVHAEMPVHREYALAWRMPFTDPGPGIFWANGDSQLSVRTLEAGAERYLIVAGSEHKVGVHNAKASLMALQAQVHKQFGTTGEPAYVWSAQNYQGADHLPYIGRDGSGMFVATGFATDGLTWGTVAAQLIAQELAGTPHTFAEVCKPNRLSPLKGGKVILEENISVAAQLIKDYLTDRQEEKLTVLAPGDSAIVDIEGESVAAWRSPEGELFAVSPVCTHMGCKVHWNSVEVSWDCPCHGSRFRPDGTVIEGPAITPLKRKYAPIGGG